MLDYDDCESLRSDAKGCGRPVQVRAAELVVPKTFVFPMFEARVERLSLFPPGAMLPPIDRRPCRSKRERRKPELNRGIHTSR